MSQKSATQIEFSEAVNRTAKMKQRKLPWRQLKDRILHVLETDETQDEYLSMSKDAKLGVKDVGGYVMAVFDNAKSRKNENFAYRTAVTLDADHIEDSLHAKRLIHKVKRLGLDAAITSTHSHTDSTPRLRFVFPLKDPVDDPEKFEAVCRLVASKIDIDAFDATGYQSSRLMFWSSRPKGAPFVSQSVEGPWLDADDMLQEYGKRDAWKDRLLWPRGDKENEHAVARAHVDKAGNPLEKPGIIGLFNRCFDVPTAIEKFIDDVYIPTTDDRYSYSKGSSSNGAVVYDGGLFLYSHHETDPCGGKCVNSWDMIRLHKFGHLDEEVSDKTPISNWPSSIAMRDWAKTLEELSAYATQSAVEDFKNVAPFDPESQTEFNESMLDAQRWAYVTQRDTFFDLFTGLEYSKSSINTALARVTPDVNVSKSGRVLNSPREVTASDFLTNYLECNIVKDVMYYPLAKSGVFTFDSELYANSFIESSLPPTDPDWEKTRAKESMLEYIHGLIGERESEMLIKFLAHNVQFPGVKIAWCPIIKGIPGDGKTTLAMILAAAMGRRNVKVISTKEVTSSFNEWAHGACLGVMEEIRVTGHNRHDVMNTLKPLITNDYISIIGKGVKGFNTLNTQNYIAFTNHSDALAIDHDDRRWYPMFTHYESKDDLVKAGRDEAYFNNVYKTIQTQISAIRGWLLSIDLSDFNRHKAPETNKNKIEMIFNSLSYNCHAVLNAIELGGVGVCDEAVCTTFLNELIAEIEGKKIQTRALAAALEDCGYRKFSMSSDASEGRFRLNGRRTHVYVKHLDIAGSRSDFEATPERVKELLDATIGSDFDM